MDADQRALKRFLDGDEKAFEELVVRYEARVRNLAFGLLRDEALAEDVAQETFLTAHRKAASYRFAGSFRGWLFSIAVRRARDELRRRRRKGELPLGAAPEPATEPQINQNTAWDINRCLSKIRPEHRIALIMRDVEGLSYREMADALDWPLGTVQTRVHRARLELRAALREGTHEL